MFSVIDAGLLLPLPCPSAKLSTDAPFALLQEKG